MFMLAAGAVLAVPASTNALGFGSGCNSQLQKVETEEGVTSSQCDDGDGVPVVVENAAPAQESTPPTEDTPATPGTAQGDHNADGVQDSQQSQVASLPNPNDQAAPGSYVTLEVLTPDWNIKEFAPTTPEQVDPENVPQDSNFPVGLFDIKLENKTLEGLIVIKNNLNCNNIRSSILKKACLKLDAQLAAQIEARRDVEVRLLFDRVIDHSDWQVQQYVDGEYANYDAVVKDEVVGFLRTTITWTLRDGGEGDLDGVIEANGKISDPIGPRVAVASVAPVTQASVSTTAATQSRLAVTGGNGSLAVIALIVLVATISVVGIAIRSERRA